MSPRISLLTREIEAGDQSALARFWDEAAAQGTPLIERIGDDPKAGFLLTFIYRGGPDTTSVRLAPLYWPRGDHHARALKRLGETDIWHSASYAVSSDHRSTYSFIENDPEPQTVFYNEAVPDPLNKHPMRIPPDAEHPEQTAIFGRTWALSTAVLPDAPSSPWLVPIPGVPAGKVEMHRFESRRLSNERRVWVYTPPGYDPVEEHWLLVLLDGWQYLPVNRAPTVLDNLIHAGKIPRMVAVMIDSLDVFTVRTHEMKYDPGFADVVTTELLSWARARYSFTDDPARRIIGGTSLGGLTAAFIALRGDLVFGGVLSQSGAFNYAAAGETDWEGLARMVTAMPRRAIRFWLDVGSFEEGRPALGDGRDPGMRVANERLRDALQAKGYEVRLRTFTGGHDFAYWPTTFPEGLIELCAAAPLSDPSSE